MSVNIPRWRCCYTFVTYTDMPLISVLGMLYGFRHESFDHGVTACVTVDQSFDHGVTASVTVDIQ